MAWDYKQGYDYHSFNLLWYHALHRKFVLSSKVMKRSESKDRNNVLRLWRSEMTGIRQREGDFSPGSTSGGNGKKARAFSCAWSLEGRGLEEREKERLLPASWREPCPPGPLADNVDASVGVVVSSCAFLGTHNALHMCYDAVRYWLYTALFIFL